MVLSAGKAADETICPGRKIADETNSLVPPSSVPLIRDFVARMRTRMDTLRSADYVLSIRTVCT